MRLKRSKHSLLVVLTFWIMAAPAVAHDEPSGTPAAAYGVTSTTLLELWGPKEEFGAWYLPPLPPLKDRMQSVHVALLPDGKVLIVNGSSFRIKYCKDCGRFEEGVDGTDYNVVDNTAIYDPQLDLDKDGLHPLGRNAFQRIDSPPTGKAMLQRILPPNPPTGDPNLDQDETRWSNDLFCAGHLHTPDGNVLFFSGNRMNYPGMLFTGSKFANIYDWRAKKWREPQAIQDGHWYPTLVELADGQIVAISGLRYMNQGANNNNSPIVEFYDYRQPPDKAWTYRDILRLPNSPFNTPLVPGRAELDKLDHYPRIFPLADGRLFITGDGSGGGNPKGRKTYFMTITPSSRPGDPPDISFELGPDRLTDRRVYGSGLIDPNSPEGNILLMGGMLGSERTPIGPEFPPLSKGNAVTANLERFRVPGGMNPQGSWEVVPHFLGDRQSDVRIMHVATILPTRQFLVMGGGNFPFHRPIFEPLLFSPKPGAPGGYEGKRMNPGTQPRLYHSVSLLLPDGRIFVSGGNAVRAAIEVGKDGHFVQDHPVYLNTYRNPANDTFSFAEKGKYAIPGEIHQFEIFYPPYLFAGGKRPVIRDAPKSLVYGQQATFHVENMIDAGNRDATRSPSVVLIKLGSVTHAFDFGQCLYNLPFTLDLAAGTVTIQAPTNPNLYPPGYYMLFYVNNSGKPSVAPVVNINK